MPQQKAEKQYNTFIKGLVTEVSPLTFPENSALDISNLILERSGKVSRRLGMEFETAFAYKDSGYLVPSLANTKISYHSWPTPSGHSEIHLGVVRVRDKFWFMDTLTENPSANFVLGGLPIVIPGLANSNIDITIIHNNLVVVSKDLYYPKIFIYRNSSLIEVSDIEIKLRDIWGVEDGIPIQTRPVTLSDSHHYNLINQGWNGYTWTTCGTGINSIACTKNVLGIYPAHCDLWTLGKDADIGTPSYHKYNPELMSRQGIRNNWVAKGMSIIDIYERGPTRVTAASTHGLSVSASLPLDRETGRLSTVASFAGRLFYSGVISNITQGDALSPNYSGMVFFSQVGHSTDSLGKCYQDADPTSEEISDIIPTDGGVIHIPDISYVHKLLATRTSLLVFAQNGVWEIFGDTGGFTATSFQISKVSTVGLESPYSIIETNDAIFYWAKGGIYALTQDQISGRYKVENLSITTIQTFYNNIKDIAKKYARGFYEEIQNRVRWLYNDTPEYAEGSFVNKYNKELILDLTLGCFYVNEISMSDSTPYVADYASIPRWVSSETLDTVYAGNEPVFKGTEEVITRAVTLADERESEYKFLCMNGTRFTLGEYSNIIFKDWVLSNGAGFNYSSYLITGYEIYQDFIRKKQVPYLIVALERTEDGFLTSGAEGIDTSRPSSCLVQAQWNWSNSLASNKWGTIFQAYRHVRHYIPTGVGDLYDTGEAVIVTKSKLRGSGKALSLKFQSEEGKDMRILGWGTTIDKPATA